jgi:effector-binding domain-containing protein
MQVKPADNGVQVIWSMESSMPRPMNLMMLFMDMEAMIGKDFDKGLEKLKSYAESPQASFKAVEHNMPACKLLYIRRNIKVEEVNDATKAAYEELYRFTGMASIKVTGAPLAIYEQWDGKQAEILWSLPVESLPETISGKILKMEKPETFTLLAVYKGGYAGMENFYEVFDAYIQSKGYTITGGPIEEYVTDPEIEKDTSAWITNVYFPVSKAPSL